jgi:peptide/nickel transport system permease protein
MSTTLAVERSLRFRRPRVTKALRRPLGIVGATIVVGWLLIAVFAPLIAPSDPLATGTELFGAPSSSHLFGTDELGRDVLSRVLYGARVTLPLSILLVALSLVIGSLLGAVAGYIGGWLDGVIMRVTDLVFAFPAIVLAMVVTAVLGPSLRNAVIALAVYFTPMFIRLVRTETQRIRYSQLTEAEQAIGVPHRQILVRHVLPNIAPSLVVQIALTLGTALLAEASLSFLGLGVRPPGASWGAMLRTAYDSFLLHPWQVLVPALAVASAVLAWNLLADGIRAAFGKVEG